MKPIERVGHKFSVDRFSWVEATNTKNGGTIKEQSVEALLLLAILEELVKLNEATP